HKRPIGRSVRGDRALKEVFGFGIATLQHTDIAEIEKCASPVEACRQWILLKNWECLQIILLSFLIAILITIDISQVQPYPADFGLIPKWDALIKLQGS